MALSYLTYLDLMRELASLEDKVWEDLEPGEDGDVDEALKYKYVQCLNAALRWVWSDAHPEQVWPETISLNAAVSVTSGSIDMDDVSTGTQPAWVSLWTSDPLPFSSAAVPVVGVPKYGTSTILLTTHPSLTTVYAYYRSAVPQGEWTLDSIYNSPNNIPGMLRQPILLKARASRLASIGHFAEAEKVDAQATAWMDARIKTLQNVRYRNPWERHYLTF